MQIPGQHHSGGFVVLCRRTAAAVAVDVPAAAVGGTAGPSPAGIGDVTERLRVTGGFHYLQNEAWL